MDEVSDNFDIIVADPPWRDVFGKTSDRTTLKHYSTMRMEDLSSMSVPARDNALLVLWALPHMLQQALDLMAAWGFSYRTSGVWVKTTKAGVPHVGKGKWLRNGHEPFLIGRRGRFECRAMPGVIMAPRGRHSEKPEALQDNIEAAFPGLQYLELFARRHRPGWTCLGDELQTWTYL